MIRGFRGVKIKRRVAGRIIISLFLLPYLPSCRLIWNAIPRLTALPSSTAGNGIFTQATAKPVLIRNRSSVVLTISGRHPRTNVSIALAFVGAEHVEQYVRFPYTLAERRILD